MATKQELLDAIRDLSDGGSAPTLSEMNKRGRFSAKTYYNHFESWNTALKKAGFEINKSHNEKLEKKCEVCGDTFKVVPSYEQARFCSQDCHGIYRSDEYSGDSHPRYKERVTVECAGCGSEKEITQIQADRHERHFCSLACRRKVDWPSMEGKNNPKWTRRLSVECAHCGETVSQIPSRVRRYNKKFCSLECQRNWQSENWIGENNPNWQGGGVTHEMYGSKWEALREEVINDQGSKCQSCGASREAGSEDLHVHHVVPLRNFRRKDGSIDTDRANRRMNLVALCGSCHKKWEGLPVVPRRA